MLEAFALEEYRAGRLSEPAVREMLCYQTRTELHAFLKQHGVYLHYDVADLEHDKMTGENLRGRLRAQYSELLGLAPHLSDP